VPEAGSPGAATAAEGDSWEMVSSDVPSAAVGSTPEQETLATLHSLVTSLSEEGRWKCWLMP